MPITAPMRPRGRSARRRSRRSRRCPARTRRTCRPASRCTPSRRLPSRRRRRLGGGAQSGAAKSLAATAAFLKTQGTIQTVLADYSVGVDPQFVQKAAR
jgi:hypothetical protein